MDPRCSRNTWDQCHEDPKGWQSFRYHDSQFAKPHSKTPLEKNGFPCDRVMAHFQGLRVRRWLSRRSVHHSTRYTLTSHLLRGLRLSMVVRPPRLQLRWLPLGHGRRQLVPNGCELRGGVEISTPSSAVLAHRVSRSSLCLLGPPFAPIDHRAAFGRLWHSKRADYRIRLLPSFHIRIPYSKIP